MPRSHADQTFSMARHPLYGVCEHERPRVTPIVSTRLRQKQSPCAAIFKGHGSVDALYFGHYTASLVGAFYVLPERIVNPVTTEPQHLEGGGPYRTHMRHLAALTQAT